MLLEPVNKNVLRIMTLVNNLVLFVAFKAKVLCSVHFIWFVKHVFSAKIQFVKTSVRIVKYVSQVATHWPIIHHASLNLLNFDHYYFTQS